MTTPRDYVISKPIMNNYIINVDSARAPKLNKRVNKGTI